MAATGGREGKEIAKGTCGRGWEWDFGDGHDKWQGEFTRGEDRHEQAQENGVFEDGRGRLCLAGLFVVGLFGCSVVWLLVLLLVVDIDIDRRSREEKIHIQEQ